MVALRFAGRTVVALALASLGVTSGCYSSTPHRVQIVSGATPNECWSVVGAVFTDAGFSRKMPTPPNLSMLFGARTSNPDGFGVRTSSAVGVMIRDGAPSGPSCKVTLEMISPDVDCTASVNLGAGVATCQPPSSAQPSPPLSSGQYLVPVCPPTPVHNCKLSYAPGAENDAAADELARRVQVALGRGAVVAPIGKAD
jgi:hypothetical protein